MSVHATTAGNAESASRVDQPGPIQPDSAKLSPRAATIGRLAAELASLAAAGDADGARVVHEAIARLLARPR